MAGVTAHPETSDDSAIARILASEPSIQPTQGGGAPGIRAHASAAPALRSIQDTPSPFLKASLAYSDVDDPDPEYGPAAGTSLIYPTFIPELKRDATITRQLSSTPSVRLKPRVNPPVPHADHILTDRELLLARLDMYNLAEKVVKGDGACQFRALSDQLYGSSEHPREVREAVVEQLKAGRDKYANYVPTDYDDYLRDMARPYTWGDHVTLQAAADKFGCRIMVLASYKEHFVIAIEPEVNRSTRVLWLCFWAEVHYNSLLSKEDLEPVNLAGAGPPRTVNGKKPKKAGGPLGFVTRPLGKVGNGLLKVVTLGLLEK